MNTRRITIGRIIFAMMAFALLAGFTARSARAMDGTTITGRAAEDTALCLDMGGSPRAIGSSIYCVLPGGHGWVCEEAEMFHTCSNFLTTAGGPVKGAIGQTQAVGGQVIQPSSKPAMTAQPVQVAKSARAAAVSVANP